jgi:hypothetical protein
MLSIYKVVIFRLVVLLFNNTQQERRSRVRALARVVGVLKEAFVLFHEKGSGTAVRFWLLEGEREKKEAVPKLRPPLE